MSFENPVTTETLLLTMAIALTVLFGSTTLALAWVAARSGGLLPGIGSGMALLGTVAMSRILRTEVRKVHRA